MLILCQSYRRGYVNLIVFDRGILHQYSISLFIFSFTYIYIHFFFTSLLLLMQPHTHTLSLPQIHFLNHAIANKPPSFTNPHTLFTYIRTLTSFKSLYIDADGSPYYIY